MSVNVNGSTSQINTGNIWVQNMKTANSNEQKTMSTPSSNDDNAVKLSISQEGIESCRKKFNESGMNEANGKVIVKESIIRQAKQATNALSANNYGNELAKETEKLKGKRTDNGTYSFSNMAEDYVRAYGNIYDKIVQGYRNGTRERYVEDETSETGYRKMTMEEELNGLDKAFQRAADGADVKEMITNEFQRLSSKIGIKQTSFTDTNKHPQATDKEETIGQKMKKLAQVWKDTYKTSNSKNSGMEKVMTMLNDMFSINKV